MDIVVWLRSLGLGKYEAAFREVEINCDIAHAKGGTEILGLPVCDELSAICGLPVPKVSS